MFKSKKKNLIIYIYAQTAESGPPLGTILGNLGINTVKFCKDLMSIQKNYLIISN